MIRCHIAGAALMRALHFGLTPMALVVVAPLVVGCQDESQPEYWVDKLADNAWRPRAIKRLDQFFEDAVTRANQNTEDPAVTALVDKIVGPLTQTYVDSYEMLDEKARVRLIRLLATIRDKRAEPALIKALEEFGEKGRGAEEAKWAARAVADMKLTGAADAMLQTYLKTRAGTKEGAELWRDLREAMIEFPQKSWAPKLIEMLDADMRRPDKPDAAKVTDFANQQFWQITAVQVLGLVGDESAVEPLMRVVLDPSKADAHSTAILALVKLGAPAAELATKVLLDQSPELAKHAAEQTKAAKNLPRLPEDKPHVPMAAIVLGTIGNSSAAESLQKAFDSSKIENNRAVIARSLAKLPATPETKQAFQAAFNDLSEHAAIGAMSAHQALAEESATFFDADMVPWLLSKSQSRNVEESAQPWLRISAVKLMTDKQVEAVGKAITRAQDQLAEQVFEQAKAVVATCKSDTDCYLKEAQKPENQTQKTQFAGIKAVYMLGVLGDESTRDALIQALDKITNASVRYTAALVIDHLSPKGSSATVDALDKIIQANAQGNDRNKIQADAPLKQVMYRIRSRTS